ncbi:MAG: efflux RND transporter periplasmic adaptor subunit [Verrucomicrobiales bacterium]|nr:efflux RND transporter periplasmic adaptor subunit [Verrucomicrobiales bacterium]
MKNKRVLGAVIISAAFAMTVVSCGKPTAPMMPPPVVTVTQPQLTTVTNWDEYPAHLEAVESVDVRARVAGYLNSIHFRDGAEVRAGDLLFVIDPKPFEADLERARAERRRAETQLELARNDLRRAEELRTNRAISDEEFDARSKAMRAAEDALAAARAAEAAAELNLGYTRVTAPITGRISERFVTVGNMIQGSGMVPGTVLATLVSLDPIYAYFDVPEAVFEAYRARHEGLRVAGSPALPCELGLAAEEGFPHRGRVDFFDNRVDRKTGTIRMRGVFANPERLLLPGMFARVRVPIERVENALLIPEAAILSEQTRKFVYVLNAEQIVEPRPVQLGRLHGRQRQILGGLRPDDRVVVSGLLMLRPGIKAQVADTTRPTAPSADASPRAKPTGR